MPAYRGFVTWFRRPGDTITAKGHVTAKRKTEKSRWLLLDVEIRNQQGQQVARGEAMVEFPPR